MSKSEHAIVHRGYTVVPVDFRDDDWVPVPSAQATAFEIYPPGEDTPRLDVQIDTFEKAVSAIEADIEEMDQPKSPFTISYRGYEVDPVKPLGNELLTCASWEAESFLIQPGPNLEKAQEQETLQGVFATIDDLVTKAEAEEAAAPAEDDDSLSTARYSVIVTRDTTESVTIIVDAVDEDEAEEKAIQMSHHGDHAWEQDCTPNASKDHYTNGAELIDD